MVSELERLKSDLEVLQRHQGYSILENAIADIADKIARLEAEADPWHDARVFANEWRDASPNDYPINTAAAKCFDRMIAKVEAQKEQLDYIRTEHDHRGVQLSEVSAENHRLAKRVAELEAEPEFTPAVLKRAEEIVVGDVILASGLIRTVTEIGGNHPDRRIIRCEVWMAWFSNRDLIAVLRQPLVEAKRQEMERTAWGQGA